MIALAIAMTVAAVQGEVQEASPRLTVGEWRSQDERQRRILMVAALEGLMLAAAGPDGEKTGIDTACLPNASPDEIENKLRDAPEPASFVMAMVEASGC